MSVRSRLTGIATGDQGIFARREVFERGVVDRLVHHAHPLPLARESLRKLQPA